MGSISTLIYTSELIPCSTTFCISAYLQRIDMNDMFSDILRESDVELSRYDQTRLDSASESKK